MRRRDPYDCRVAFDDVLGGDEPQDIIDMAGATLREFARRRLRRMPPTVIETVGFDSTEFSFSPTYEILGGEAGVAAGKFPLFDLLRARFSAAIGRPKLVRVDGEESYQEFRSARRRAHLDDLEERLSRLEAQVADHVSDHHGGGRVERLEDAFEEHLEDEGNRDIFVAVVDAARGGRPVPLAVPPQHRGRAECWLDQDEVLVSTRTPAGIFTTGAPVQPVVEELVGCAEVVGCCGLEALLIGAQAAPSVTGRQLLDGLLQVAQFAEAVGPEVLGEGVYLARPQADPEVAATMALLQRAQRRDRRALREAAAMVGHGHGELVRDAADRLYRAQVEKARRG